MPRLRLAIPALALATTLTGCGQLSEQSSGTSSNAFDPVNSVSALIQTASSSMQDTSTVTVTIDLSGGGTSKLPERMSGAFDLTCEVDMDQSRMSCDGGVFDMITTEKAAYFKSPLLNNPSKPWTKIELKGPRATAMRKNLARMKKATDFKAMLPDGSAIADSSSDVVNGQLTTRYELTIDLNKALQQVPEFQKKRLNTIIETGVTEIALTVWISENGLPVKVETVVPPLEIRGVRIPKTTTTVTYSKWGEPVDIAIPPANKVRETTMPSMPTMPDMPN